jgi:hypothetical protein
VNPQEPKIVVVGTTRRDVLIGVSAGIVLIAGLLFGFFQMSHDVVGNGLTGVILSKTFTPLPEEQITIGKHGVHERRVEGEYVFVVHVEAENKDYTVWIDKQVYDSRQVGDRFYFLRPPRQKEQPDKKL